MADAQLTVEQADAATDALVRFHNSAEDFLRYRDVYLEAVRNKKALLRKEVELKEKNERIEKLESAISIINSGGSKEVSRAKVEIAEAKKNWQIVTEEKRKTEIAMKEATQSLMKKEKVHAEMRSEVRELKKKVETLAVDFQNEKAAKEDAASRLGAAEIQLGIYTSYTANLVELNITKLYVCLHLPFL
jgi:DNA repair exonuclease SbcCD ATPase subunit